MSGDAVAIALGAVSALGLGEDAFRGVSAGEPARVVIASDALLSDAGLRRPFCARAPADLGVAESGDRATDLLVCALSQLTSSLDALRPGWRDERVGIAMGSSSGGMLTAERFFAALEANEANEALARGATYFAPLDDALARVDLAHIRRKTQILAACAASTIALGVALRWLDRGACDLVLAGGYDGLSVFVASGFEALRATTATRPRPFRLGRDGMSLGEGAGVVALVRERDARGAPVLARISGFGASNDAVHITAPDRTGSGLVRAATRALEDAGLRPERVDLVSAHATATPFNDAMESRAVAALFASAAAPIVHPFKAEIGHTLGAAGVLETLAAATALRSGIAPAAAGEGALDPDAPAYLLERAEPRSLRAALKLSAAFGGTNAALVLSREASGRTPRPLRSVYLRGLGRARTADLAELSEATGIPRDRLARLDMLGRLALSALAALAAQVGKDALAGAGIIAGHALATIDTNARFDERRRKRGAAFVEPRLFPATSPNAVAGECAIAYGLTGPSFSVGAGLAGGLEALACAAELVAAGDADRMVVVAADDAGPVARELARLAGFGDRPLEQGAVALLLGASSEAALRELPLDLLPEHEQGAMGQLGLLEWLGEAL